MRYKAALISLAGMGSMTLGLAPANAATVVGGETLVTLTAAEALADLGLNFGTLGSATFTVVGGMPVFTFAITGGDLDAMGLGTIEHDGSGLRFADNGDTLDLSNFLIDTTTNVLSGLVTANGSVIGTVNLFDISPTFDLALTAAAAAAFGDVFDIDDADDLAGTVIGTASVNPELAAVIPEPQTWAMLIAGFILTGAAMRRRHTRAIARVAA